MVNLETLQHRKVVLGRYLFTQGISGKHYFYSDKDQKLKSLSKKGAFSKAEEPQTEFSFEDQFEITSSRVDFKLSKDESKLKIIAEDPQTDFIGEYLMTETTPGEGFTNIDK